MITYYDDRSVRITSDTIRVDGRTYRLVEFTEIWHQRGKRSWSVLADFLLEQVDRTYTRGAYRLEIWGRWRGVPVRLLQTRDALRFGQIYRALQRALESSQPGHPPADEAR